MGSDHTLLIGPLLTIGIGISLPWGLMDGLAVSVVPKERAGMATGIFSTTRVAGEGVALAIVSAVLSALTRSFLGSSHEATTAAQRLVTGDLQGAVQTLSCMEELEIIHAYNNAFSLLLWLLTGITILTAIVIFTFMGRGTGEAGEMAEESIPA